MTGAWGRRRARVAVDAALVAALLAVAVPVALHLGGAGGRPMLILGAAAAPWSVPLAALVAVALAGRVRTVVAGAAVALLAAGTQLPLHTTEPGPDGEPLVVMTANLLYGRADAQAVVRTVERERVGSGLWSRHPLVPAASWDMAMRMPGVLLDVHGVAVRVQVVHPSPAHLYGAESFRAELGLLRDRVAGLDQDVPTVVLGDFNASLGNIELRRVLRAGRLRDATDAAGAGLTPTWSPYVSGPRFLQIDHVLVSRQVGVRAAATRPIPGSDHRAVVAELRVGG